MSAYVVSATHNATCAKIIREEVFGDSEADRQGNPYPTDKEIRREIAEENVLSVSWRYGPEGRAAYASLFAFIDEKLKEAGYSADQIASPEKRSTEDINEACFVKGYTLAKYMRDIQKAKPIQYTKAEAYMYLTCFGYQACEHPEWKTSLTFKWIQEAESSLGYFMAKEILDGRHVWSINEDGSGF